MVPSVIISFCSFLNVGSRTVNVAAVQESVLVQVRSMLLMVPSVFISFFNIGPRAVNVAAMQEPGSPQSEPKSTAGAQSTQSLYDVDCY